MTDYEALPGGEAADYAPPMIGGGWEPRFPVQLPLFNDSPYAEVRQPWKLPPLRPNANQSTYDLGLILKPSVKPE